MGMLMYFKKYEQEYKNMRINIYDKVISLSGSNMTKVYLLLCDRIGYCVILFADWKYYIILFKKIKTRFVQEEVNNSGRK